VVLLRLVIAALAAVGSPHSGVLGAERTIAVADGYLVAQIRHYRGEAHRWQRLMGRPVSPSAGGELHPNHAYRRWVRDLWRRRALAARHQAQRPPHKAQWLCIHTYEGAWELIDGPYYGGLQMDLDFQRTWGPELLARKGTADRWTPLEQMWVAERAFTSGLGYRPWPNTARMCGLL
jgi:hypothetical protein